MADRIRMADMLGHANLVVTAWEGARTAGIARTLTDFTCVGYMSDLPWVSRTGPRGSAGD